MKARGRVVSYLGYVLVILVAVLALWAVAELELVTGCGQTDAQIVNEGIACTDWRARAEAAEARATEAQKSEQMLAAKLQCAEGLSAECGDWRVDPLCVNGTAYRGGFK